MVFLRACVETLGPENCFSLRARGLEWKRPDVWRVWCSFPAVVAVALGVFAGPTVAQTNEIAASPTILKKLSLEELVNVEVTSVSRRPEKWFQTASAIQVVTSDDIRRSGASSIPEALRLADNLEVAQKNSHDWGISARGFNTELANKLLVLVDGRTVYTPLFSGVFWDRQDYLLQDLDRIEVISGPGGALWGANAVNGVINITTKSARDTTGLYVEAGGGTQLQDFAGVRYGGQAGSNVFYRVYGKYFDRDDETFANGKSAGDSWRMGQGGFRIDAEAAGQNTFTLQGDFYEGDEGVTTGDTARVSGGNVLGRWSHAYSEDSHLSLQVYYDRTHLSDPIPALVINAITFAPAGRLKDDLDTGDIDLQHRFRWGERNQLVWGLGYRFTHDVVKNAPAVAFFPPVLDHDLFTAFAQDEISLLKHLTFTLGTKLEHNDYTRWEVEPSARLAWTPTEGRTLWGAVSRAVRTPSRIDRDLAEAPPPNVLILKGGPDFKSETVIAYEAGGRAQLGSRVVASISAFYNDYDYVRSTSITPGTIIPLFFENNLKGETYGFELSANYQLLDWWRLHAGYDLLKEHLRVKSGQTDLSNARNETADPQQQFAVRSFMDLPQHLELYAGLRWVDALHNNNGPAVGTVPSYVELDARLSWRPVKRLELSLTGQNLLHARHPEFGFPQPTRVEIGRSVYGKVAWGF